MSKHIKYICGFFLISISQAAFSYFDCDVNEVLIKPNLIHVRCSNNYSDSGDLVKYFAKSTVNTSSVSEEAFQADLNRFVSLALFSFASKTKLRFDSKPKGSEPTGCASHDCRGIINYGPSTE